MILIKRGPKLSVFAAKRRKHWVRNFARGILEAAIGSETWNRGRIHFSEAIEGRPCVSRRSIEECPAFPWGERPRWFETSVKEPVGSGGILEEAPAPTLPHSWGAPSRVVTAPHRHPSPPPPATPPPPPRLPPPRPGQGRFWNARFRACNQSQTSQARLVIVPTPLMDTILPSVHDAPICPFFPGIHPGQIPT